MHCNYITLLLYVLLFAKPTAVFGQSDDQINWISFNQLNDSLQVNPKKVFVDFYADWCGPCQMLSPIVDEVAEERDDIKVGKINVDEQMELAQKYGVMTIPTLLVIKNGEIANKHIGALSKSGVIELL